MGTARGMGSIPGQGTKIPPAGTWLKKIKANEEEGAGGGSK